jgi:hypothetical protein
MDPTFKSSHLKIERAKHHISDLNAKVAAFAKRHPYRLLVEADPKAPGECYGVIRVREELPGIVPIILGDAVHNLRSALDHMACELVRRNGGSTKRVQFPFAASGDDLEKAIKHGHIDRASPQVLDKVRSLKPYKRGNEALRAVHDLDITDKHDSLVTVGQLAGFRHIDLVGRGVTIEGVSFGPVIDGMQVIRFSCDGKAQINHDHEIIVSVTFGRGQPFQGQPVIPTLHQLTELVDGVVRSFEPLL